MSWPAPASAKENANTIVLFIFFFSLRNGCNDTRDRRTSPQESIDYRSEKGEPDRNPVM
jgi:hypothetical protein